MNPSNLQKFADEIAKIKGFKNPQFIGRGAFKETFRVLDLNDCPQALKIFIPEKMNLDRSLREIEAMKSCSCPNISKLIDFNSIQSNGKPLFYMLEDYYDGGTLTERGCTDMPSVLQLGFDISNAIRHLQKKQIVHRDIKPDNIMFRKGESSAILVDLGLVRKLGEASLTFSWAPQGPGTPLYSAPEQLLNEKELIDWRTDQFALGVMLSIYMLKHHPFQHKNDTTQETIQRVANREELPQETIQVLNQSQVPEIISMLNPWPIKRINSPEKLINIFRRA